MNQNINPDMLILARESRGYTQTRLSEEAGISQGNFSKYESGLIAVPADHLQNIADVLGYPVTFFHQVGQRYGFGSSCTYHRKRQTMPVGELRRLLAQINIRRLELSRLLNNVEIEFDNEFPRLDLEDFGGSPEQVAQAVRQFWKLPFGPVNDLATAIEGAGGIVIPLAFGTNKLDAISQVVPGTPPVFFANSETPVDRMRFTLAHELGHIIMHQIPNRDNQEQEREADRFAAEFLMPAKDILPHFSQVSLPILASFEVVLAGVYGGTRAQAHDLGKMTDWQYRRVYEQLSSSGYRINEPVALAAEKPTVLMNIVEVHLKERGWTVDELSQLAALYEDEFRQHYALRPSEPKLRLIS